MIRFIRSAQTRLQLGWFKRVRGEAALVLLARLANVATGAVLVLLTARHLGPTGRGEITIAFTLAWATTSFADLGTSTSGRISLLSPMSDVTTRDVFSVTAVLLPLQVVVSTIAVTALSMTSLDFSLRFAVATVALSVAMMMLNSSVNVLYGLRRYVDVLVTESFLAVFQIFTLVGLLWTGRLTATSAVTAMAVGPILGTCWIVRASGVLHLSQAPRGRFHWRRLIVDGLSPMAGTFSIFVALRLNRIVLAVAVGTHSLGLFTVAIAVPETLRVLPKAVGQVIADRARSGVDQVVDARRHARLLVVGHGLVLAVATLVAWMFVPVVFGEGFRQAREVLVVLAVAELVLTFHFMYQALLIGFGRVSGIGLPSVVGAVVMVALNLIMIPAWGMQGAAWACLLGFSALAAVSIAWTNRELRRIG